MLPLKSGKRNVVELVETNRNKTHDRSVDGQEPLSVALLGRQLDQGLVGGRPPGHLE